MNVEELPDIINIIPYNENLITESKVKESAVLVPIIEKEGKLYILFEKRSQFVSQPGEICFPGGKVDQDDESIEFTAVRETIEELGYKKEYIQVLGKLGVLPSYHQSNIHCYIGFIHWSDVALARYNQDEVEEVLLVDMDRLLLIKADEYKIKIHAVVDQVEIDGLVKPTFPAKELGLPDRYHDGWQMGTRNIVSYDLGNEKVWGLTGFILKYFIDRFKNNY